MADSPREQLRLMSEAMRSLSYEGTLVYIDADGVETMAVEHAVIDGREYERLLALSGEPVEIMRHGDRVVCVYPDSGRVLSGSKRGDRLPGEFAGGLDAVPGLYRVRERGRTRMTGRTSRKLSIDPGDGFRYGYRLWIDDDRHLLLRADLVDADGNVIERMMFTHLELVDRIRPVDLDAVMDAYGYRDPTSDSTASGDTRPAWVVGDAPPGFEVVSRKHGAAGYHAVLSDGLATVSVFVEDEPADDNDEALHGLARMGAVHAFGRLADGRRITVVGEVPAATVRRIAESVGPAVAE